MPNTREKLIELLERFETPIMFGGIELMKWTIPTNEILTAFADHLITNGVTVQQWIPVTERLPNSMANRVLAFDKSGRIFFAHYEDYRGVDLWYDLSTLSNSSVTEANDVTHWMPLPEAPKIESI